MEGIKVSRNTLMRKGNTSLYIAIICLIILWGCAKKETVKNIPTEEVLRERVAEYWDFMIKGEIDKSYLYEEPYYRKTVNMTNHIKSINTVSARWKRAEIKAIKIKDNMAEVDLLLMIEMTFPKEKIGKIEQEAPLKDKWISVDGIWYHQPSKGGLRR